MKVKSLTMLLSLVIMTVKVANSFELTGQLFLVGGGLKTCTSIALKNCNADAKNKMTDLESSKVMNLYQVNDAAIDKIKANWPENFNVKTKQKIIQLLERTKSAEITTYLSLNQLKTELKKRDQLALINKLSDPEYYALLDFLEQPVIDKKSGVRSKELVNLHESTNVFSTQIYKDFVNNAKRLSGDNLPKIIVLTASARDSFEAADFYQEVFRQAGSNAQWLPLDATLNALLQIEGSREDVCQTLEQTRAKVQGTFNRESVYPDLTKQQMLACLSPDIIYQAINNADGVFINGGDQSLTLKAFINKDGSDSQVLTLIKDKLKNNSLIIGGTSAGTAVMSGGKYHQQTIPMITNGQSDVAIVRGAKKDQLPVEGCHKAKQCSSDLLNDDLTYRSKGGLGVFKWGITDTHFSERGRQGRLMQLVKDTNVSYAFGVDEATALIVKNVNSDQPEFHVIGQGGVFIIENDLNQPKDNRSVATHYVSVGDIVKLDSLKTEISIAPWKTLPQETSSVSIEVDDIFDGERYQQTTELLCRLSSNSFIATDHWEDHDIEVAVSKNDKTNVGYGVIDFAGVKQSYCSYQNFELTIGLSH